ncbi:transposase family protein [Pontiella sulfatireligans]|nr:transposase family protein [Pontiella sulfatireligans]
MKRCLQRLGNDWNEAYGHSILVAENFVDPQLFRGSAYKALGQPRGMPEPAGNTTPNTTVPSSSMSGRSVRTRSGFCVQNRCPNPGPATSLEEKLRCRAKAAEPRSIREHFAGMEDDRKGHNWPYTLSGLCTLVFCASLAGMSSGQRDLAEYARDMGQGQLRARVPADRKTGEIPAPGETSFFRLLSKTDPEKLQEAPHGSRGLQLVSAFCGETGRRLGIGSTTSPMPAWQQPTGFSGR